MIDNNPLISPAKGDVVRSRHGVLREVVYVEHEPMMIQCIEKVGGGWAAREKRPTLKRWRKWAAGGVVVKRGEG